MSFFSEVVAAAGLSELKLAAGYTVINYNGEAVYVEGAIRLLSAEPELIKIELKGAVLSVAGTALTIFELSDTIIIKGKVANMEFLPYKNKKSKDKIQSKAHDEIKRNKDQI